MKKENYKMYESSERKKMWCGNIWRKQETMTQ